MEPISFIGAPSSFIGALTTLVHGSCSKQARQSDELYSVRTAMSPVGISSCFLTMASYSASAVFYLAMHQACPWTYAAFSVALAMMIAFFSAWTASLSSSSACSI